MYKNPFFHLSPHDTLKRVETMMERSAEPVKTVFEVGNHCMQVTGPV